MAITIKAAVIPKPGHLIFDDQNTSIGLDVVPSENHVISSTITDHPVEEGSNISDHARPDPDRLTLECIISNTPLPPLSVDWNRAQNSWVALRKLRDAGSLVTVLTTLGRYESMEIEQVSVTRDAPSYNALAFTVSFKKIRIVQNRLTSVRVSKQKNVSSRVKTGSQTPEEPDEVEKSAGAKLLDAGKGLLKASGGGG